MKVLPTLGVLAASAAVAAAIAALVSRNCLSVPASPDGGTAEEGTDAAPETEAAAEAGEEQS